MTWQDGVNGAFECGAGLAIAMDCLQMYKDKCVKGVYWPARGFFLAWGIWNLYYYYPYLDQWLSFVGGLSIATANCIWLVMMAYYLRDNK